MSIIQTTPKTDSSHWYTTTGEACYEVPRKTGDMRSTTLADARKMNLLPSVTTVLQVLDKPGLNRWKCEQAALAVATTPRADGEELDSFIARCLDVDAEQEGQIARDRGTELHNALESLFLGNGVSDDDLPWVTPAYEAIRSYADTLHTEKVLVGDGYAGKCDLLQMTPLVYRIWDYKTCKKLPSKGAWDEHRLQLAAYAAAWRRMLPAIDQDTPIICANCYISTVEQGAYVIHEHLDWKHAFRGFACALAYWQWLKGYVPHQEGAV